MGFVGSRTAPTKPVGATPLRVAVEPASWLQTECAARYCSCRSAEIRPRLATDSPGFSAHSRIAAISASGHHPHWSLIVSRLSCPKRHRPANRPSPAGRLQRTPRSHCASSSRSSCSNRFRRKLRPVPAAGTEHGERSAFNSVRCSVRCRMPDPQPTPRTPLPVSRRRRWWQRLRGPDSPPINASSRWLSRRGKRACPGEQCRRVL